MPFKEADVELQYKKDENLKREHIQVLKEWVDKQPHLPQVTELQLILFLQSCYYRMEAAKSALDNYFTVRTLCPEIFGCSNLADALLKVAIDTSLIGMLPQKTPEGYTVVFTKLMNPNPDMYNYTYQLRYFDMISTLYGHLNGISEGYSLIIDMDGGVFAHLTKLNISSAKKHLFFIQEALPIRLKQIHFINVVPFMDKILSLFKPFMKKELIELLNIHTNGIETLYKWVPQEVLPVNYGGRAEDVNILHEKTKNLIYNNKEFYEFHEKQTIDKSKRPEKSKNLDSIFGIEGTFKKLDID